jgi:hypothetical protein
VLLRVMWGVDVAFAGPLPAALPGCAPSAAGVTRGHFEPPHSPTLLDAASWPVAASLSDSCDRSVTVAHGAQVRRAVPSPFGSFLWLGSCRTVPR